MDHSFIARSSAPGPPRSSSHLVLTYSLNGRPHHRALKVPMGRSRQSAFQIVGPSYNRVSWYRKTIRTPQYAYFRVLDQLVLHFIFQYEESFDFFNQQCPE